MDLQKRAYSPRKCSVMQLPSQTAERVEPNARGSPTAPGGDATRVDRALLLQRVQPPLNSDRQLRGFQGAQRDAFRAQCYC